MQMLKSQLYEIELQKQMAQRNDIEAVSLSREINMIKIYHNPRCSKSRQGLAILQNSGKTFEIIKYLDQQLTAKQLTAIIDKLGIKAIDLVRKNEAIWKSDYKGKTLTDTAIIEAMIANPKLIERPIVINKEQAVVGRPPETILNII